LNLKENDMTDMANTAATSSTALLKGTAAFIKTLKIAWITLATLFVLGFGYTFISGKWTPADVDPLTVIAALAYCVIVYALIHSIGAIVHSVRQGDPFTAQNASRLRKLGWMFLIIGLVIWFGDSWEAAKEIAKDIKHTEAYTIWISGIVYLLANPALILASPLMFILARVFDVGIAMREDVEGTV
jgi:hypothetical protein